MPDTPSIEARPAAVSVQSRRSGLRILVWIVGIVVVLGMGISILLPSLCRSSETANRVKCASNLRQIGQAILMYTQSNGGQYPPSLAALIATEDITAQVMTCPSSNDTKATDTAGAVAELTAAETDAPEHEHCLSYIYVGRGLSAATVSPDAVVAYEPLAHHNNDGGNVLFGDGHVEFLGKQDWLKATTNLPKLPAVVSVTRQNHRSC